MSLKVLKIKKVQHCAMIKLTNDRHLNDIAMNLYNICRTAVHMLITKIMENMNSVLLYKQQDEREMWAS